MAEARKKNQAQQTVVAKLEEEMAKPPERHRTGSLRIIDGLPLNMKALPRHAEEKALLQLYTRQLD